MSAARRLWHGGMARSCLLALAVLFFLGSAPAPQGDADTPDISARINAFSFDLLKQLARDPQMPANSILSPQSIFHGLAMSYIASDGKTRTELAAALHFPDDNKELLKPLARIRQQMEAASTLKKIDVTMANSLWLDETYARFRDEYLNEVREAFAASMFPVAFKHRQQVSDRINGWVSEKTHGRIAGIVSPDDFKPRDPLDQPALVTVNAVYFKADWGSRFDKSSTRMRPFHAAPGESETTLMMHQRSLLEYAENKQVQFLEIPYIGGSFSMYVVLPQEVLQARDLLALVTPEMVAELKDRAHTCEVDALVPRFEMKGERNMKSVLVQMGVRSAFESANLDRMIIATPDAVRIYISAIYHNAWIDVHEEGTEAAAAAIHFSVGCSAAEMPPPRVDFHADHPFLFLIVHNPSRSILFTGWVSKPGELAQQSGRQQAAVPR